MLIRSAPLALERKRVPIGPCRLNMAHPLAPNCVGLWLFNGQNMGVDLTKKIPPLGFYNSARIISHIEGPALDTSTSAQGGCSLSVVSGSPAYVTSGNGLSSFIRWSPTVFSPDQYALVFGMAYDSVTNPYTAQQIFRQSNTTDVFVGWNYGGVNNSVLLASNITPNVVKSQVISHTFSSTFKFFSQGVEAYTNSTNTAAPTYGTTPIIGIGREPVSVRNSQAFVYLCGFFNRGLTVEEALLLETNPYDLVEPTSPILYSMYVAPPAARFRRRALNGGIQDLQYQPSEIRKT